MANSRLSEIRNIRLQKLDKLRSLGIDPYPSKYSREFIPIDLSRKSKKEVDVVGRLWSFREHGNVIFADLRDASGQIQLMFQKKVLGDNFKTLKLLDSGDFLGVSGNIITTQAGEITIDVLTYELLSKSLRPVPDDWNEIKDEETRYRQRYVDLMSNQELRDMFVAKSKFWNSMRSYLIKKDFLEVETPVLENISGGADASPFITHHNALDIDLYLRISMGELWQKRLMVAGFEKTFEIGRQFRNEGIDREHLQDYTQMEFYWSYANYEDSMNLVEEMYKHVANEAFGTLKFKIESHIVDLSKPWKKIDYCKIILEKTGKDLKKNPLPAREMDQLWKSVRKSISGPVFLVGHPVEVSPLAKRQSDNPKFVQRYQVIFAGSEMGNGYSELNDPVDQAERFESQQKMRDAGDDEAQMYDHDFVRALEYGMPPVTGFGVSERLFSFLANKSVRETILFPLLRPEYEPVKTKPQKTSDGVYAISSEVKQKFPGVSFTYTIIRGVKIKKTNEELEQLKKLTVMSRKDLTLEEVSEIPPIKTYRQMLKSTGVDTGSRRPSPEALIRRIVQGKNLYNINTAVDAYNIAVIETAIGLGGFDFANISEPVSLRFAKAGEEMHLLGDEEITKTKEGELVYADAEKLLTLDLNYRDIDATKITEKTKDIILFADGGPDIDSKDVVSALEKGASYIMKFCGGEKSETKLIQ